MTATTATAPSTLYNRPSITSAQSRSTSIASYLPQSFRQSLLLREKKSSKQCQVYPGRTGQNGVVASNSRDLVYGGYAQREYDKELRMVLELATDEELFELEGILFGPSYFSPLLKSITDKPEVVYGIDMDDVEEREAFISQLESRFLFLAADAHATIRMETFIQGCATLCEKKVACPMLKQIANGGPRGGNFSPPYT